MLSKQYSQIGGRFSMCLFLTLPLAPVVAWEVCCQYFKGCKNEHSEYFWKAQNSNFKSIN